MVLILIPRTIVYRSRLGAANEPKKVAKQENQKMWYTIVYRFFCYFDRRSWIKNCILRYPSFRQTQSLNNFPNAKLLVPLLAAFLPDVHLSSSALIACFARFLGCCGDFKTSLSFGVGLLHWYFFCMHVHMYFFRFIYYIIIYIYTYILNVLVLFIHHYTPFTSGCVLLLTVGPG